MYGSRPYRLAKRAIRRKRVNVSNDPSKDRLAVGTTILLLVGAAGFMAVFFGLYQLLGMSMPVFGLLFLVYWAAILKQDLATYFPAVFGGLSGILLGWLLVAVPPLVGSAGIAISLMMVAIVLFCFMRGHASLIINNATMLFLTVATISQIDVARNAPVMAASFLVGAIYMGATTIAVRHFWRRQTLA
jgi:hypothetical protein